MIRTTEAERDGVRTQCNSLSLCGPVKQSRFFAYRTSKDATSDSMMELLRYDSLLDPNSSSTKMEPACETVQIHSEKWHLQKMARYRDRLNLFGHSCEDVWLLEKLEINNPTDVLEYQMDKTQWKKRYE